MEKLKDFLKKHQQTIVLVIGYVLVASLGFGLGRFSAKNVSAPEIKIEQSLNPPTNYTPNVASTQTIQECAGKIKGSSSKIYHLPGGAFYDKTTHPVACFGSEAEAQAAGYRKSSK